MNAEEFLKSKGIGKPTIKAVRLSHKHKNIELEIIPLMEEYAKLKLLGIADVVGQSEQLVCSCGSTDIKGTNYGFFKCNDCKNEWDLAN